MASGWDVVSRAPDAGEGRGTSGQAPKTLGGASEGGWDVVSRAPASGKSSQDGGLLNPVRGAVERGGDLVGNLLQGIDELAQQGEKSLTAATGINPTFRVSGDGVDLDWHADPEETKTGLTQLGERFKESDAGYEPEFTWERVKRDPGVGNVAGYIVEQGVRSTPDMAAVMANMPSYVLSRTREIAGERARNEGREEVTTGDMAKAAPAAIGSAALERVGARGVFGVGGVQGAKDVAKEAAKAGAKEGATEFGQENIEYAGATLGTEEQYNVLRGLERGLAGSVAGGGFGAGTRASTAATEAALGKAGWQVESRRPDEGAPEMPAEPGDAAQSDVEGVDVPGMPQEDRQYLRPEQRPEGQQEAARGLPAPRFIGDPQGEVGTEAQQEARQREREALGLTPDVERARRTPRQDAGPSKRIGTDLSPQAATRGLPAPQFLADSEGRVGTQAQVEAQRREREALGLTPDVERARQTPRQDGQWYQPAGNEVVSVRAQQALPEPQMRADAKGNVGTEAQFEAERQRRRELGLDEVEGARQSRQTPLAEREEVRRSNGRPYPSRKAAQMAIRGLGLENHEPVQVEGGWVLRRQQPKEDQAPGAERRAETPEEAGLRRAGELRAQAEQAQSPDVQQMLEREADVEEARARGEEEPKLSAEERARRRRIDQQVIRPEQDDLVTAMRKLGGLDTELESDWRGRLSHIDTQERRPSPGERRLERPGKEGARSLDDMAEQLQQYGYLESRDARELEDKLFQVERGTPVYSTAAEEDALIREHIEATEAREQAMEPDDQLGDEEALAAYEEYAAEQAQAEESSEAYSEGLAQLAEEAEQVDPDTTETILEDAARQGRPERDVARDLISTIRGSHADSGADAGAAAPAQGDRGEAAGAPGAEAPRDLAGEVPEAEQRIADAERDVNERLQGQREVAVGEGPGELFAQGQTDLEDVAGRGGLRQAEQDGLADDISDAFQDFDGRVEKDQREGFEERRQQAKEALDSVIQRLQSERDDWASRSYRDTSAKVEFAEPGSADVSRSMNARDVNESRRKNRIRNLDNQIAQLESVRDRVAEGEAGFRQVESQIRSAVELSDADPGDTSAESESLRDQMVADRVLGDSYRTHGEGSAAREIRRAIEGQQSGLARAEQEAQTSPDNDLPEPTDAQKEAGNYKVGKTRLHGLEISIENPAGSTRSGTDPDGNEWSNTMTHSYGYIRRTEGKDGDQVDAYFGPEAESDNPGVYVIDQVDPKTRRFDEHKVMFGFPSEEAALQGYLDNYEQGWTGIGNYKAMDLDGFKEWLQGDTTKPVAKPKLSKTRARKLAQQYQSDEGGAQEGTAADDRQAQEVAEQERNSSEGEITASALEAVGARPWTHPKTGQRRWYFNNWEELVGLDVDRYRTGNVSSATLDGERISNNAAKNILGSVDKVWYDEADGEIHTKGLGRESRDLGREEIRERIKERVRSEVASSGDSQARPSFAFAGQRAETADTYALDRARQMLEEGADPEQVRQETGWFRGPDGKWRFEISDEQASLKPAIKSLEKRADEPTQIDQVLYGQDPDGNYYVTARKPGAATTDDFVELVAVDSDVIQSVFPDEVARKIIRNEGGETEPWLLDDAVTEARELNQPFTINSFNALPLGNVLDHPQLFAAYPGLRDIMVQVDPSQQAGGSFSKTQDGTKVIRIGKRQKLTTLLHEIQHGIQNVEGFASGGTESQFENMERPAPETAKVARDLVEADNFAREQGASIEEVVQSGALDVEQEKNVREALNGNYEDALAVARKVHREATMHPAGMYQRLAGEVEARNTQARQGMTAAERQATPPEQTADRPAEDVIVQFNGEVMENAPRPANALTLPGDGGLTRDQAQPHVDELVSQWAEPIEVSVVDDVLDMPMDVIKAAREQGAVSDMRGAFKDGRAYLVAPRHDSLGHIERTLLHEAVGHHGLRRMMGDDLKPLLNKVWMSYGRSGLRDVIDEYFPDGGFDVNNGQHRRLVAEEKIARMAEDGQADNRGLVRRFLDAVRRWARKAGFRTRLDDADLRDILRQARRTVERGGIATDSAGEARYARGEAADVADSHPEDIQQGKIGSAVKKFAGERLRTVKGFSRKYFTTSGNVPEPIWDRKIQEDGWIRSHEKVGEGLVRDLDRALRDAYGRNPSESQVQQVDAALKGQAAIDSLPESVQKPVRQMRAHIDALSRKLIREGVVSGDLAAKIADNLGVYATRSYRVFDDPKWAQKVDPRVVNKAKAFLRDAYADILARERAKKTVSRGHMPGDTVTQSGTPFASKSSAKARAKQLGEDYIPVSDGEGGYVLRQVDLEAIKRDMDTPGTEANQYREDRIGGVDESGGATGIIGNLLFEGKAGESPVSVLANGKLGAKDLSVLKGRKDIAPEIRALWGEYQGPMVNYSKSVNNMIHLISNHRLQQDMRDQGMGRWFTDRPQGEMTVRVATSESDTLWPMTQWGDERVDVYTTPEIKEALETALSSEPVGWLMSQYMKANAAVKYSATVGSVQTHMRNLVGNTPFAISQGHWRAGEFGNAAKTVIGDVRNLNDAEMRNYLEKMLRLGVIHESVRANELRDVLEEAMRTGLEGMEDNRTKQIFKGGARKLTEVYQAQDDVWKIYAFENEKARFRKALPDKSLQEIEERAAKTVRMTYPTYSLVPEGVKKIRRWPLTGPFVSFPAEVIRVAGNTMRLIHQELRSDNPELRKIGAQRLAGAMVSATLPTMAAMATMHLSGLDFGEDDDVRQFLPPWSKHSDIMYFGRNEEGQPRWVDLSYTDPYAYLKTPLQAFLRGEDWQEKVAQAGWKAAEPFLGEEILAGKLIDAARNRTQNGGQIYNPSDDYEDIALDVTGHIAEAFNPGTISSLERVYKGLTGDVEPYGKSYDPGVELGAMLSGFRVNTLDVPQALGFKARDYAKGKRQAARMLTRTFSNRGEISSGELRDAFRSAVSAHRDHFTDIHKSARAAIALGLTKQEVAKVLDSGGVAQDDVEGAIKGVFVPYRPSQRFFESVLNSALSSANSEAERRRIRQRLEERYNELGRLYEREGGKEVLDEPQ